MAIAVCPVPVAAYGLSDLSFREKARTMAYVVRVGAVQELDAVTSNLPIPRPVSMPHELWAEVQKSWSPEPRSRPAAAGFISCSSQGNCAGQTDRTPHLDSAEWDVGIKRQLRPETPIMSLKSIADTLSNIVASSIFDVPE